jgi:nucleoside-diphosphate-sugar epimerase
VSCSTKIIEELMRVAPVRQETLNATQISELRDLTRQLILAKPEARAEYARFLSIQQREIGLDYADLSRRFKDASILVTGGTGCIGSELTRQLMAYRPSRLVSYSRGITPANGQIEYLLGDVRDVGRLADVITTAKPNIIFHTAAQRSPALAEKEVHRTVTTNVLGSRNVLSVAAALGVPQVIMASTGKALRPYSPEIYTASKRAAEFVGVYVAENTGTLVSAARFTHVIDNSIIHERLLNWAKHDEVIRLHGSSIGFYVQSARESAQLLLAACLNAKRGEFRVNAITDLGWPTSLLDVAIGVINDENSKSPVYISGYDPGYEEVPFPGLYDPATAGDVSPLLNAFETAAMVQSPCENVDTFTLKMADADPAVKQLAKLADTCRYTCDPASVTENLDEVSWSVLGSTLAAASPAALYRSAKLVRQHDAMMSPVHQRIAGLITDYAKASVLKIVKEPCHDDTDGHSRASRVWKNDTSATVGG